MFWRKARRVITFVAALYLLACCALGIFLAEAALHPWRKPITRRAEVRAMVAERYHTHLQEVAISAADGALLRGWFARPDAGNGDVVVLLHGVADNREGMAGFAEFLLSHGYSVLLPDARAQGESGGDLATYGVLEADDVHRWVDWLYGSQHPDCVFGMGESLGAALVLESLRTQPRFCAVVAESPFATFREVAFDRVGEKLSTGPWLGRTLLRPAVEAGLLYARLRYKVDLGHANPGDAVAGTHVPVLLIHGLADRNIPPQNSEEMHARNPAHTVLWEVPGAGHCGAVNAAPQEFDRRVLGWFGRATSAPRS